MISRRKFLKYSGLLSATLVMFNPLKLFAKSNPKPVSAKWQVEGEDYVYFGSPEPISRIWFVDTSKKKSGDGLSIGTAFNNYNEAIDMCRFGSKSIIHSPNSASIEYSDKIKPSPTGIGWIPLK